MYIKIILIESSHKHEIIQIIKKAIVLRWLQGMFKFFDFCFVLKMFLLLSYSVSVSDRLCFY